MSKRITLSEIAKACGLSIGGVSLALRNSPEIAKSTRERVQAIAKELGYRPDPFLSQIGASRKKGGTYTGGRLAFVVFPPSARKRPEHRSGIDHISGARQQTKEFGMELDDFHTEDHPDPETLPKLLKARNYAGLILFPQENTLNSVPLPLEDFPVVLCNPTERTNPFVSVKPDVFASVQLCAQKVSDYGYRRIGFAILSHPTPITDDAIRHASALECCLRLNSPIPPLTSPMNDPDAFVSWFKQHKPEALIAFTGLPAYWVQKIQPDPVPFANLIVNRERAGYESGAWENPAKLGATSVQQLMLLIRSHERGPAADPATILIQPQWNEGTTLPSGRRA